ncbi:hypothetical protein Tco_0465383 [Tanacetum coccineum]
MLDTRYSISNVSVRDPRFTSLFWQGCTESLRTRLKFSKSFSSCGYDGLGERILKGPVLIVVSNEKVAVDREKLKEDQTRQKSDTDRHRSSVRVSSRMIALSRSSFHLHLSFSFRYYGHKSIGDEEVKEAMGSIVRHLYMLLHEVLRLWKELWSHEVFQAGGYAALGHLEVNRISLDLDRTWVDGILRYTELVGYGPTMLLLRYSDHHERVPSYFDYRDASSSQLPPRLTLEKLLPVAGPLLLQFLGASCTQRKVSMVLFVLPSILLLVVIVVTVVIVVVIPVVVVVAIVRVVVAVVVLFVFAMSAACDSKEAATLSAL